MTEQQIADIRLECIRIIKSTQHYQSETLIKGAQILEKFVTFDDNINNITYRLECIRIASSGSINLDDLIYEATNIWNYTMN